MSVNYIKKLPRNFPEVLLDSAFSMESIGINELVWNSDDAINVICFLSEHNYAILGGDVYKFADRQLVTSYDNWYLNKEEAESWQHYVRKSKEKSISYIDQYSQNNGNTFYYAIIFESEEDHLTSN